MGSCSPLFQAFEMFPTAGVGGVSADRREHAGPRGGDPMLIPLGKSPEPLCALS